MKGLNFPDGISLVAWRNLCKCIQHFKIIKRERVGTDTVLMTDRVDSFLISPMQDLAKQ